jgi:fibronectin type 3 domain-containing protein
MIFSQVFNIKDFPSLVNSTNAYVSAGRTTFTVPNDGNYFIAFNHYSGVNPAATTQNPNPSFVLIDDVAITVPQPPAAPTTLTATASTTQKQIALSWTASTGAGITGYRVERGTSATGPFTQIGTTTTAVTYTDNDNALVLNTAYFYQVKAVDDLTIVSAPSNVANATIVPTTPSVPTGLTATASTTQKQIALSWTAPANATSYSVERRTGANAFAQIATNLTGTTYTDSDAALAFNTVYDYQVKANNGFNTPSAASTTASASVVNVAPNAPVLNAIVNATTGLKNTLTWNSVAGAVSYRIESSTTSTTAGFTQLATAGASPTSYEHNGVTYQQQYHYRVYALNAFGTASPASNVQSVTVTAIENPALSELIQVYPNPVSESKFKVELPEIQVKAVTFVVFDAKGKEVYRAEGKDEKTFALNATGLAKGLYFVHINTNKGLAIKKVVIE